MDNIDAMREAIRIAGAAGFLDKPEQMEEARMILTEEINANPSDRERLEAKYGKDNVWDTDALRRDFTVDGFSAPFVVVRRKSDNALGSLEFQHSPRLYYNFVKD